MENGVNGHKTCDKININNNLIPKPAENNSYCEYLEGAIFGSPAVVQNLNTDHLKMKKNKQGLIANLNACDTAKRTSNEIIKHNVEKVHFYEQSQACSSVEDVFVSIFIKLATPRYYDNMNHSQKPHLHKHQ